LALSKKINVFVSHRGKVLGCVKYKQIINSLAEFINWVKVSSLLGLVLYAIPATEAGTQG
jgi:hypothetical protein